jgi:hypothetical protein
MTLLPSRYKVITATVDGAAGEIGTVYQACGFDYVGTMRAGGRTRVAINGTQISERQAGRIAGARGARALAQLGFDAAPAPRIARRLRISGIAPRTPPATRCDCSSDQAISKAQRSGSSACPVILASGSELQNSVGRVGRGWSPRGTSLSGHGVCRITKD